MKKMGHIWLVSAVLAVLFVSFNTADADTVLEVDFDALTPGPVTAATLDSATTGGTWITNTSGNATHSIEDDASVNDDLAYLSTAQADGQWGAVVVLDTPVEFAKDCKWGPMNIYFQTGTRNSTGFTRSAYWKFYSNTTQIAYITLADGNVNFSGEGLGLLTGAADANNCHPWDSTSDQVFTVDLTIDKDGVMDLTMSRTGTNVSGTVTNSSMTHFDRIETSWNNAGSMGVFLNNMVITVPAAVSTVIIVK